MIMEGPTFANIPAWIIWAVGLAQIVFAIAFAIIAAVLVMLVGQLRQMLNEIHRTLPSMMANVDDTVKNVKIMSDDARDTTHQVTGTVNRVSTVVSSVAGRMESPVVRSLGLVTGLAAGLRAMGGKKQVRAVVVEEKPKRRGFLGF